MCGELTPREKEVVRYLMLGFKERDVARVLRVSKHTVHTQITNAHRKLGVSARATLIAAVIARNIITVDEVRALILAPATTQPDQTGD